MTKETLNAAIALNEEIEALIREMGEQKGALAIVGQALGATFESIDLEIQSVDLDDDAKVLFSVRVETFIKFLEAEITAKQDKINCLEKEFKKL